MKKIFCLLVSIASLVLLSNNTSYGKAFTKEEIKKNLPKILGVTNAGNEYYITFHPCWETAAKGNDLKIYVSAGVRTKVNLEVAARGKYMINYTVPNDIIEFTLSAGVGQCYRKSETDLPYPDQLFQGMAVHVWSDDPIICYGVTNYINTSDGFLALPVQALGKEYLVASWNDVGEPNQYLTSYTSVVGAYDRTKVFFTFGGNPNSKSVSGLKPGVTTNITLNAGDVFLIGALGTNSDLTGSHVVASKPVAVISGNFCAYIPTNCGVCDFISEMELPTYIWGNTYHVTNIVNRKKNSMIRVFAKEPNTKIFRDGIEFSFIKNVGGMEGDGWLSLRADSGVARPVVISGDKPINVTQYNTGQLDDSITSDPFQMVLTPIEQYQTEILFHTPGIRGGQGFLSKYINICYQANDDGTIPDDLEFAIVNNGQFEWQKLKTLSPAPGDEFALKVKGKRYFAKTFLLPGDGVYKLRANAPFAAYSYGFDWLDAYGFPASVGLKDMYIKDSVPPDPVWKMECDGTVNKDGKTEVIDMPDDATNRSNLGIIYMHTDSSFNYRFYYADFMPGEDRGTNWNLVVIDKTKEAKAVITFADRSGNDTTITINYYGMKLTIRPKTAYWSSLAKGEVNERNFWVINDSKIKSETVVSLTLKSKMKGTNTGFDLTDMKGAPVKLPFVLQPQDSVQFKVKFTAIADGIFKDSIGVGDSCIFTYRSCIEAAVGSSLISVSDWNYGVVTVTNTRTADITIKNQGSVDLKIFGYSGPTQSVFVPTTSLTDYRLNSGDTLILAPGSTRTFQVQFQPTEELVYPDSIVFFSNTQKDNADSVALLYGRGFKPFLIANSYNWGNKIIDRQAFPAGPYPAIKTATQDTCIKLKNNGSKAVLVRTLSTPSVDRFGSSFTFDKTRFQSLTINAMDSVIIPVAFQPKVAGVHELVFQYDNDGSSTTETRLYGIGIDPLGITALTINPEYAVWGKLTKDTVVSKDFWLINNYDSSTVRVESMKLKRNDQGFKILDASGGDLAMPLNIPFRDSIPFKVQFTAKLGGNFIDSIGVSYQGATTYLAHVEAIGDFVGVEDYSSENLYLNIFPNPTDGNSIIEFRVPAGMNTELTLYNIFGDKIDIPVNANMQEGINRVDLIASELPSGVYHLVLRAGVKILTKKVIIQR